jgi:hypothetical protein
VDSLISIATAMIASTTGPFISVTIARMLFKADMLSANRRKWARSPGHETRLNNDLHNVPPRTLHNRALCIIAHIDVAQG